MVFYPLKIMTKRQVLLVALSGAVAALFSGCQTFDQGASQNVAIYSFPAGAEVLKDGEVIGKTPLNVPMARKVTHQVVLKRDGYKDAVRVIAPADNPKSENLVQFGLLHETGYYVDLYPNPVEVQLVPDLLPATRSADAYGQMAELILRADQMRAENKISPVEHKYIVDQIVAFYAD